MVRARGQEGEVKLTIMPYYYYNISFVAFIGYDHEN